MMIYIKKSVYVLWILFGSLRVNSDHTEAT